MKNNIKEEILKYLNKYIEKPFRHTQIISKENSEKAIDEYVKNLEDEWILVENDLPDTLNIVWVTLDDGTLTEGQYSKTKDEWIFTMKKLEHFKSKVIAWRSYYPKPYKP